MKRVLLIAVVAVAAVCQAHQGVKVTGRPSKGTTIKVSKEPKANKAVGAPKKHRKKFLGIF